MNKLSKAECNYCNISSIFKIKEELANLGIKNYEMMQNSNSEGSLTWDSKVEIEPLFSIG